MSGSRNKFKDGANVEKVEKVEPRNIRIKNKTARAYDFFYGGTAPVDGNHPSEILKVLPGEKYTIVKEDILEKIAKHRSAGPMLEECLYKEQLEIMDK